MHIKHQRAFTLIEALVTIAIIGMMLGLLVPLIDRSLSKNRLSNDVEILKSKLEEVRLLSGSTQQADEIVPDQGDFDSAGYYAVLLHANAYQNQSVDIVRLSYPVDSTDPNVPCLPETAQQQAFSQSGPCFVERIILSRGVTINCRICGPTQEYASNHLLAFRIPTRQLHHIHVIDSRWTEDVPVYENPVFELTFQDKRATVSIDPYTGKVTATY